MKKNLFYPPNLLLLLFFVFLCGTFLSLTAQQNLTNENLAVSGYDLVSYQQNEVAEGSPQFKVLHNKAVYLFKNEANQKAFKSHPEKYLPQYGGWCAYAMGKNGDKVSINPEAYTLEEGKLYLFYKTSFTDTRKKWIKNNEKLKSKADQNWIKLTKSN